MGEQIESSKPKQPLRLNALPALAASKTNAEVSPPAKATKLRYTAKKSTDNKNIDKRSLDNSPNSSYNRTLLGQGASISKQQKRTQELTQALQALLPEAWEKTQESGYTLTLTNNFQTGELGLLNLAKVLKNKYGLPQSLDIIMNQLKNENPDNNDLAPGQVLQIAKTLKQLKGDTTQTSSESSPSKDPNQNIKSTEKAGSSKRSFPHMLPETVVLPDDLGEENNRTQVPLVFTVPPEEIPKPPTNKTDKHQRQPQDFPQTPPRIKTVRPVAPTPPKPIQKAAPAKAISDAPKSAADRPPSPISPEILKARQYEVVRLQEKNQPLFLRLNQFNYQRADANGQKFDLVQLGGEERYGNYRRYLAATAQQYHEGFQRLEALAKNNNVSNADFQKYYGQLQQMATGIDKSLANYKQGKGLPNASAPKLTIPKPSRIAKSTIAAPPPDLTPKQIIQRQQGVHNNIKANFEVAQSNQSGLLSPIASLWDGIKSHGFSEYNPDGSERSRWDPRKWGAQIISYDASSAAVQQHLTNSQTSLQKLEAAEKKLDQAEAAASNPKLTTQYLEKFNRQLEKVDQLHERAGTSVEKYTASQEACVDLVADIGAGVAAGAMYAVAAAGAAAAPVTGGSSLIITGLALTAATATGALVKPLLKASHELTGGRSYNTQKLRYDAVTGGLAGLLAPVAAGTSNVLIKKVAGTKLITGLGINAVEETLGKTATSQGLKVFGSHMTFKAAEKTIQTQAARAGLWAGREAIQGSVFGTVDAPTRHVLNGGSFADIPQVALQGGIMGGILGPIFSGTLHGVGKGVGKIATTGQKLFLKPKVTEVPRVPKATRAQLEDSIHPQQQKLDELALPPDVAEAKAKLNHLNAEDKQVTAVEGSPESSKLKTSKEKNLIENSLYTDEASQISKNTGKSKIEPLKKAKNEAEEAYTTAVLNSERQPAVLTDSQTNTPYTLTRGKSEPAHVNHTPQEMSSGGKGRAGDNEGHFIKGSLPAEGASGKVPLEVIQDGDSTAYFYRNDTSKSASKIIFNREMSVSEALQELYRLQGVKVHRKIVAFDRFVTPSYFKAFLETLERYPEKFKDLQVTGFEGNGGHALILALKDGRILKLSKQRQLSRIPHNPVIDLPIFEHGELPDNFHYYIQAKADTTNVTSEHVQEVINNIKKEGYVPDDIDITRTDQVGLYQGKPYLVDQDCAESPFGCKVVEGQIVEMEGTQEAFKAIKERHLLGDTPDQIINYLLVKGIKPLRTGPYMGNLWSRFEIERALERIKNTEIEPSTVVSPKSRLSASERPPAARPDKVTQPSGNPITEVQSLLTRQEETLPVTDTVTGGRSPVQLEVDKYYDKPLPFQSVNTEPELLTWKDFDQDEFGNILLYRGLDNMDLSLAKETAHQSHAAAIAEPADSIFNRYGTSDVQALAKIATESNQGASPMLHTTRNKALADGLGSNGVTITYKVPKSWLLQPENRPVLGNIGEQELNFFYALPKEFVSNIEQFGKDIDVVAIEPIVPQPSDVNDIISSPDLPPPPIFK